MMHKRRENVSPLLLAALAKWMRCQIAVTNPAPYAAIPLVLIVATREVLVVSLHDFLIYLTVTAVRFGHPVIRQGRFCFFGICTSSLLTVYMAYKKSTAVAVPLAFSSLYYITEII